MILNIAIWSRGNSFQGIAKRVPVATLSKEFLLIDSYENVKNGFSEWERNQVDSYVNISGILYSV